MRLTCCLSVLYAFAPQMNKRQSLPMIRANLSYTFGLYFCVYLLLCASLRLLYLRVTQILYSMHVLCFIFVHDIQFLLLKFFLTCLTIQHSVWHLWLLQSPHCQIPETTLALFLGSPSFLNLRQKKLDESTLDSTVW